MSSGSETVETIKVLIKDQQIFRKFGDVDLTDIKVSVKCINPNS